MKNSNPKRILVILRHGDYGDVLLSSDGINQIKQRGEQIDSFLLDALSGEPLKLTTVSLSEEQRAIQSALILARCRCDTIVKNFYLTKREYIHDPQSIFSKLMSSMNTCRSNVIIVVAHGEMIPVLAETAIQFASNDTVELRNVSEASGYIVDLDEGNFWCVSEEGVFLPKPEVVQTEAVESGVEGDEEDDDIPF